MTVTSEGQMFSNPGNDAAVMAAWERFVEGGSAPADALRSLVDSSWQRCQAHRVDPARRSAPPPDEAMLAELRHRHAELLLASGPVMACARDFLAETGTVMALADTRSTILSMEGDGPTLDSAESIQLVPGVDWTEQVCGTNAIGTALAVGEAVQIHSAEHYCAGIKRWTCAATVIRHPQDGEVIGVVDVSGLSETYSRQSLALVVTTARRIESRLTLSELELRYTLLDAALQRFTANRTDGIVLFDRRGYPVKANANAQAALAALGAPLDLARPSRIPALALGEEARALLPFWLRRDWLEPVLARGERIGTLLVLPLPSIGHGGKPEHSAEAEAGPVQGFERVVSDSTAFRAVVARASQLARSRVPVLLLGETGAGKEEFARGIHAASGASGPFVALNCGGLSRELLASELFGYAEGAFTGARRGGMAGKIEAANGGTLFLDEIGEMPSDLQPHLLRVLEQGEIYRLGENQARKVAFRLVAATHRDLRREVAEGRFRMDLYYRVAVTALRIPALRDRPGDVCLLAEHFLAHFRTRHGLGPRRFDAALLAALEAYPWPGNVRELKNVVESLLLMSEDEVLGLAALPAELLQAFPEPEMAALPGGLPGAAPAGVAEGMPAAAGEHGAYDIASGEQALIRRALRASRGNLTQTARALHIAKSTLYVKLKRYGLEGEVSRVRGSGA